MLGNRKAEGALTQIQSQAYFLYLELFSEFTFKKITVIAIVNKTFEDIICESNHDKI